MPETLVKPKNCNLRHPKACKRYVLEGYCRFGDNCGYFHADKRSHDVKVEVEAAIKPFEHKIKQF